MAWERIDQLARRVIRQLELGMADEAGEEDSTPPATDAPQAEGSHVAKGMEKGRGRCRASQARTDKKINRPGGAFTGEAAAFANPCRRGFPQPHAAASPVNVIELPVCIAPRTGRRALGAPVGAPRYELLGRGNAVEAVRSLARQDAALLKLVHAVNLAETG
jgi:hypothetical protein